jgi:hypothetical protein
VDAAVGEEADLAGVVEAEVVSEGLAAALLVAAAPGAAGSSVRKSGCD